MNSKKWILAGLCTVAAACGSTTSDSKNGALGTPQFITSIDTPEEEQAALEGFGCPDESGVLGDKVLVCHVPPGNPANEHNICISVHALKAHVGHHNSSETVGDYLGQCGLCGEAGCSGDIPPADDIPTDDTPGDESTPPGGTPTPTPVATPPPGDLPPSDDPGPDSNF